jgi:hypothetical protein
MQNKIKQSKAKKNKVTTSILATFPLSMVTKDLSPPYRNLYPRSFASSMYPHIFTYCPSLTTGLIMKKNGEINKENSKNYKKE